MDPWAAIISGSIVLMLIVSGVFLHFAMRKSDQNAEQRYLEKQERKRLKKVKAQAEHEAILSIRASLEELASRHRATKI